MSILIYILRSKDGEIGFCFKQGSKYDVYTYNGINLLSLYGDGRGRIVKHKVLDTEHWIEMTHIFNTGIVNLAKYDQYIVSWAEKAGSHSLFEDLGVTTRAFAEQTVNFFLSQRDEVTSFIAPKIWCYYLGWTTRTRVDSLEMRDMQEWYRLLEYSEHTERSLLEYIAESGQYYHREVIDGETKYYYLTGVTIRYQAVTIPLELEDGAMAPLAPTVCCPSRPDCSNVGVVATTTTVATNNSSSQGGLLIIVLLFTILIVLLVIAVLILEFYSEEQLIGPNPIAAIPTVIPI